MIYQNHRLIVYQSKEIVKFVFKKPTSVLIEPDGTVMTSRDNKMYFLKTDLIRASAFHMPNRN